VEFGAVDFAVLFAYLVLVTAFGAYFSRSQVSSQDYFLGGRKLPWGAVAFSIVAAETSTLTVISVPGLAYLTNFGFLQLAFGYILGRIFISFVLLPAYARGELNTAYELLSTRYGPHLRNFVTLLFQFTRLLADGVRLFATAIPLAIITGWDYPTSILVIGVVTILYTYLGGIRAIVWLDVIQMLLYVGGAILSIGILFKILPGGVQDVLGEAARAGKFAVISLGLENGLSGMFRQTYTLFGGLIGGAFLSMASHGTDQLIVQKLLSCRSLRQSQRALITSGFVVTFQFALFLFLGALLYLHYGGVPMRSDEVYPRFMVEGLPPGVSGLLIAGIFGAAISTLSASLNALASTTLNDLLKPRWKQAGRARELFLSRILTVAWGLIFVAGAMFFKEKNNPVVELGLGIASFTYGGMLGTFFLGVQSRRVRESDALVALWTTVAFMVWVIHPQGSVRVGLYVLLVLAALWIYRKLGAGFYRRALMAAVSGISLLLFLAIPPAVAWPWYVFIGTAAMFLLGNFLAFLSGKVIH
jgi:SSS family transporter